MSASNLPEFQYHHLRSEHFRLIHVDTERKCHGDLLNLQMRDFQRKNAPEYVALSYTWGTSSATCPVSLNGQLFHVRPNLYEFLEYVTQADESRKEWTFLWIDALCINQANNEEKAQQIRVMHFIYGNASLVISWLGTPAGLEDVAKKQKFQQRIWRQPNKAIRRHMPHNEYFSRLWILQELWSSKKHTFICARRRFNVIDDLICLIAASRQLPQDEPLYQRFGLALNMAGTKRGEYIEPWRILHNTRQSDCTDPRDRVFAILNLLEPDYSRMLAPFFPDYDLSVHRVNLITIAFLRQQYGDEDMEEEYFRWGLDKYCSWFRVADLNVSEMKAVSVVEQRSRMCQVMSDPKWREGLMFLPKSMEDQTFTEARIWDLRVVASRALSFETEAEAKSILGKEWYAPSS